VAKLAGRAQRLRGLTLTEAARRDALREEWPELAEWVEAVVALVDRFRCSRTCWSEPVFALTSFARHDPVDLV